MESEVKKGVLELKVYDRIPIASRLLTMPGFEAFCVEANGHGMLPEIKTKDMLICTLEVGKLQNHDLVILRKNNELAVKYYTKVGKNVFYVSGDHRVMADGKHWEVIGIVKQILRTL